MRLFELNITRDFLPWRKFEQNEVKLRKGVFDKSLCSFFFLELSNRTLSANELQSQTKKNLCYTNWRKNEDKKYGSTDQVLKSLRYDWFRFFFAHYGCLKDIFCTNYKRVFMYVMNVLKVSFKRFFMQLKTSFVCYECLRDVFCTLYLFYFSIARTKKIG